MQKRSQSQAEVSREVGTPKSPNFTGSINQKNLPQI